MKSNSSLREKVDSITKRLERIEKRLRALEKASNPMSNAKRSRKTSPPSSEEDLDQYKYLRKVIEDAKRRYDQEHET